MRRFTRTPCYDGPEDPAIGEVRGTLEPGETVINETVGGADHDYVAASETRAGMITSANSRPRYSRPGGHIYYGPSYVSPHGKEGTVRGIISEMWYDDGSKEFEEIHRRVQEEGEFRADRRASRIGGMDEMEDSMVPRERFHALTGLKPFGRRAGPSEDCAPPSPVVSWV